FAKQRNRLAKQMKRFGKRLDRLAKQFLANTRNVLSPARSWKSVPSSGSKKEGDSTMPRPSTRLTSEKLKELARVGAEHALKELRADIIAIERTFPELALPRRRRQVRAAVASATKRVRKMSAAARAEVSRRMKRYWAARRKAKAKLLK